MDIPLNAQVECTDGVYGRSEYILINPVSDQVAHLVVKEDSSPNREYIVPVDTVVETNNETIHLRCTRAELEKMDPFIKTTIIEEKLPVISPGYGGGLGTYYYYLPFVTPTETRQVTVENKQVPPGELAVRRGTRVEATDGFVGKVDEFVINPANGQISDLVMREGHLWGKKDVIIPLSAIGDTVEDTVFLKLDKHQVESLPTFALHRNWS